MFFVAKDISCPYGLVFGGTDINVCGTDPRCKDIMLQATVNARCVMVWSLKMNILFLFCRTVMYLKCICHCNICN